MAIAASSCLLDHRPSHRIPGRVTERTPSARASLLVQSGHLQGHNCPISAPRWRPAQNVSPIAKSKRPDHLRSLPTSARSHAPPADNAAWPRMQRWRLSQASKSPVHHDQAPVSARPVQSCGLVSQFSSCPPIAVAATAPSRRLNCQPTRDTALALLIPRSDETVHSAPGRVITSSAPRRGHREAGRHV